MAGERDAVRVGSAGIIQNGEGEILLALRSVYPEDIWVLPGGGVNFLETAKETLRREIREETGLEISEPEFVTVFELINAERKMHRIILYHKAKATGGILKPSDDVKELKWFKAGEILRLKNLGETTIPILRAAKMI